MAFVIRRRRDVGANPPICKPSDPFREDRGSGPDPQHDPRARTRVPHVQIIERPNRSLSRLVNDAGHFVARTFRKAKKLRTGVQQVVHAHAVGAHDRTLPDGQDTPTERIQKMEVSVVPFSIASNLCTPERRARLRPFEPRTVMGVPETAVDKDRDAVLGKDKVRLTRKIPPMQPESQTSRVQSAAKNQLRLRITSTNARHVVLPLFPREDVGHGSRG